MTQPHIVPSLPPSPQAQNFVDQLVQALGTIASTQQEILNRLNTQPAAQSSGKVVPTYPASSNPTVQYNWLYSYGLAYNFDGTRKVQQVTAKDIEEHQKALSTFWKLYKLG